MRYASVCSGVEAASLAWMPLGWQAAWFSEIEPFPSAVLKERFPSVPNLGDMTKIEVENLENGNQRFYNDKGESTTITGGIDLLVGGTPCQDLSIAGKRLGFGGERSSLALDFVRLAYQARCNWFVWENVPGVFSSNEGRDFATLLSYFTGVEIMPPRDGFCNAGFVCNGRSDRFGVAWRVLDAQYTRVSGFEYAIPQRRRRVFVVGYFGDWQRAAQVLFEPDCLRWNTPARISTRSAVAKGVSANTIRIRSGKDGGGKGALVSNECSLTLATGNDQSVCLDMRFFNSQSEVSGALLATDYKDGKVVIKGIVHGAQSPISNKRTANDLGCCNNGLENVVCYEHHPQDKRIKETDVNGTLGVFGNSIEGKDTIVSSIGMDFYNIQTTGNVSSTLGVNCGISTGRNGVCEEMSYRQQAAVRRLMPIECERLMGFPDNWTKIPWRGKAAEDCPDAPRYKACGNSMCVNVMRWIGQQIDRNERRENDVLP